ncbi:MAG TPA: hypothetical protein VM510_12560 [Caulifigura sp.]|nr:hypothetical protein [Caulifigura sp.]
MKVTLYERVSSALMAAMLGVGAVLFAAVTYWLAHRPPPDLKVVPLEIVQLEPEVDFGGSLEGVVGGTADVDSGMEGGGGGESAGSDVPSLESTLATVTSAAGTAATQATAAYLDAATPSSNTNTQGTGTGGSGTGVGGGRPPLGFGPGKGGGVPRELRWFVSFADDNSLDEYARQLDAFGIELGVLMPDGRLIYLSQVSKSPMQRVSTSGKDEKRLYFTWQGGERQQADLQLFQRAGITVGKGTIYHFYPPRLEEVLATLEFNYAKRKAKEIRRTYFIVEKQGGAYGFKVTRQTTLL